MGGYCTNCGAGVPYGAHYFCANCGTPVLGGERASATLPPPCQPPSPTPPQEEVGMPTPGPLPPPRSGGRRRKLLGGGLALLLWGALLVVAGTWFLFWSAHRSDFESNGFPYLGGMVSLCRLTHDGPSGSVSQNVFASASLPSELVEGYRRELGDAGFSAEDDGGGIWRLPADGSLPNRVLHVQVAESRPPDSACDEPAPSVSRSIVTVAKRGG